MQALKRLLKYLDQNENKIMLWGLNEYSVTGLWILGILGIISIVLVNVINS